MSRGNPPLAAGCGAPVMGLGFLSSLVPGFCWEYEQRHSSTGDAGHAAGCSQGFCRQSVLLLLPSKHEGFGNDHPLHTLSWNSIPGTGMSVGIRARLQCPSPL